MPRHRTHDELRPSRGRGAHPVRVRGRQRSAIVGLWLLAVATLTADGAAQDDTPIGGRVMDRHGQPLGAARVTLIGRSPRHGGEADPCVVLETACDDGGRFRIGVPADRTWTAFAFGRTAEGAAWTPATRIAEDLVAGDHLTLVEGSPTATSTEVRLAGAEPWSPLAPLALRALPEVGLDWSVTAVAGRDGAFRLPALPPGPSGHAGLVVVDADGEPLWIARVPLTPSARRAAGLADGAPVVIELPPPQPLRIEVVDAAGAPVADATVRYRLGQLTRGLGPRPFDQVWRSVWRRCGTTAANGTATLPLAAAHPPTESPPFDLAVVAAKDGHALAWSGWCAGRPFRDGRISGEHVGGGIRLTLGPPGPAAARLLRSGSPWTDARVRFAFSLPIVDGEEELGRLELTGHARSDGDGRIRRPEIPPAATLEWLPMADRSAFGAEEAHRGRTAEIDTAAVIPAGPAHDVGDVDFGAGVVVELTVLDVDDTPSPDARLAIVPAGWPDDHRPLLPWNLRCDAQGRARTRLPAGRHDLAVVSARGFVHRRIDIHPDEPQLEIALEPLAAFRVRVVDAAGAPVPDLLVHPMRTTAWTFPDPASRRRATLLSEISRIGLQAWTGEDGRAACRYAAPLAGSLRVFAMPGGTATAPHTVDARSDEAVLRSR